MQETILIAYLVVSIALIGIILIQQGKGADMGASFGAGGANTVFGAAGSGNVLTKATTILAILFFAIALSISYLNSEAPVVTDAILDEASTEVVTPKSIESELPTANDSIESQVAPTDAATTDAEKAPVKVEEETDEKAEDKNDNK